MSALGNINGIILAGGKSSRMGKDKGLLDLKGKPFVQHVIQLLEVFCDRILIVANNSDYQHFGLPVFKDIHVNKGPLGGIHAGLSHSERTDNLIVSCDTPLIPKSLIKLIVSQSEGYQVCLPSLKNKVEPLMGYYSKSCAPTIERMIQKDQLKVMMALEKLRYKIVPADSYVNDLQIKSINDKQDLEWLYDYAKNKE